MSTRIADKNQGDQNLMKYQPICPILQGYYEQGSEKKMFQLESVAARHLFEKLPSDVGDMLREGFLSGEHGEKIPGWQQIVVNYFQDNSRIIPALTENPGTFTMLERMYHLIPVYGEIDEYFLMSVAGGQALKNRYDIVTNFGVHHVNKILEEKGSCLMIDIGSGPGRNGIDITLRNPKFFEKLIIECIDIDDEAITKGRELVKRKQLSNISFVKQSMIKLNGRYNGTIDLGLNIGVVCGMPYKLRVKLLTNHRSLFRTGGKLIVAGLTERMAQLDLFCAYILRETAAWQLQFRPVGELAKAAIEAGWKHVETFHDWPTKLYDIVVLEAP